MLGIKRSLLFFVFVVPVLICGMEKKDKKFFHYGFTSDFDRMFIQEEFEMAFDDMIVCYNARCLGKEDQFRRDEKEYWKICRFLLFNGANPNIISSVSLRWSKTCCSPLTYACLRKSQKMVEFLLKCEGIDVNFKDSCCTPLSLACERRECAKILELLLLAGADPNVEDALFKAIRCHDDQTVELLLRNGANPNVVGFWRKPILSLYISNFGLVRKLIQYGANVDAQDPSGSSALHKIPDNFLGNTGRLPSEIDHGMAVALLVNNGANINIKDNEGCTPLHRDMALLDRAPYVISTLLLWGGDATIKNNKGMAAYECCVMSNDVKNALKNNDARQFEMEVFVKPAIEKSQSKSKNVAHYLRNREIGGVRGIAGK